MNTDQIKKANFKTEGLECVLNFVASRQEVMAAKSLRHQTSQMMATIIDLAEPEDVRKIRALINTTTPTKKRPGRVDNSVFAKSEKVDDCVGCSQAKKAKLAREKALAEKKKIKAQDEGFDFFDCQSPEDVLKFAGQGKMTEGEVESRLKQYAEWVGVEIHHAVKKHETMAEKVYDGLVEQREKGAVVAE